MALRDAMRDSAAPYLRPGEQVQAVIGAQTASQWLAALTGVFAFLGFNRYRILVVTPGRILVLDAGQTSMKKARGVVTQLPRTTRLGPGAGLWHRIPAGQENLRVHRRFFKDLEDADTAALLGGREHAAGRRGRDPGAAGAVAVGGSGNPTGTRP